MTLNMGILKQALLFTPCRHHIYWALTGLMTDKNVMIEPNFGLGNMRTDWLRTLVTPTLVPSTPALSHDQVLKKESNKRSMPK